MNDVAIRVEKLSKRYHIGRTQERHDSLRDWLGDGRRSAFRLWRDRDDRKAGDDTIWALKDISFEVKRGDVLGIIGRNGAGKSTLLKVLSRITKPTEGWADVYGRMGTLLEVGTGFHPELTGRENVYLSGAILGMKKTEIDRRFDEMVAFAEVEKFIDTPVKRYSSGMYVRLAFAVAAHLETEILFVDEVLAVGDLEFQKKCLGKIRDVSEGGRTVLFVSHNMASIANLCSRIAWLDNGRVAQIGNTQEVVSNYVSPGSQRTGEVSWTSPETAPGNDLVRIKAVRIKSKGVTSAAVLINEDIAVEIEYWNLREGAILYTSIRLRDRMNAIVFASVNWPSASIGHDEWLGKPRPRGLYRSTCIIPANFLNSENYSVDIGVANKNNQWQPIGGSEIISFQVHETGEMKKEYAGDWAGVVRPKLAWSTTFVE